MVLWRHLPVGFCGAASSRTSLLYLGLQVSILITLNKIWSRFMFVLIRQKQHTEKYNIMFVYVFWKTGCWRNRNHGKHNYDNEAKFRITLVQGLASLSLFKILWHYLIKLGKLFEHQTKYFFVMRLFISTHIHVLTS